MLISGAIDLATPRKLVVVPGDEVVVGDRMQDYGILRQVTGIGASVIGQSVVLSFASNDGCGWWAGHSADQAPPRNAARSII